MDTFCAGRVSKQHLHHKTSWQRLFSFCDKGEERCSLLDFVKTWTQKSFPDWLRWKIGEPALSVRHSLGDLPLRSISKLHEKNSEQTLLTCKQQRSMCNFLSNPVHSLPCLFSHSVTGLVELCLNSWICQRCMYFSKLLHGFVKIDKWITLSCYMDLSKVIHRFHWIFT